MKSFKRNIILLGKLFLPVISCIGLIEVTYKHYLYVSPLSFGFIIILFNYMKIKYEFTISILVSITLSFLSLFLSIAFYSITGYLINQFFAFSELDINILGYSIKYLFLLLPIAVISPLLMFKSYHILFKIRNNIYYKNIKLASVILLLIYGLITNKFEKDYIIFWQFVMALSLQLILYQDEIKAVFNKKFGLKMNKK